MKRSTKIFTLAVSILVGTILGEVPAGVEFREWIFTGLVLILLLPLFALVVDMLEMISASMAFVKRQSSERFWLLPGIFVAGFGIGQAVLCLATAGSSHERMKALIVVPYLGASIGLVLSWRLIRRRNTKRDW